MLGDNLLRERPNLTHPRPLVRFARAAVVIKAQDLYTTISQDKGRGELKTTLKKLGFKGVRPHFLISQLHEPRLDD